MHNRITRPLAILAAAGLLAGGLVTPALGGDLDSATVFAVARPNPGTVAQIADLRSSGNRADAELIEAMVETPHAEWFTQGTPKTVRQAVRNEVSRAAAKDSVPVLVAYKHPVPGLRPVQRRRCDDGR